MAKYLLDTTVLIDYLRGRPGIVGLINRLTGQGHELGVCGINVAELYSGLDNTERAAAETLVDSLDYYEIYRQIAEMAGRYRFDFARRGISLSTTDTLVAAVAIGHGAVLVTANVNHYPEERVQVLQQP